MSGYGRAQVDNQPGECEISSTPGEGSLRLVDVRGAPHSGANGTLQVYMNGRWGGFCGLTSNYNRESLDVICRQLGYRTWASTGYVLVYVRTYLVSSDVVYIPRTCFTVFFVL